MLRVKVLMDFGLEEISLESVSEMGQNIGFLAEQPPLPVYRRFIGRNIDYSEGYRLIKIDLTSFPIKTLEYCVWDKADVEEESHQGETPVGDRRYSEKELNALRNKIF